jgi:hypothetical protein
MIYYNHLEKIKLVSCSKIYCLLNLKQKKKKMNMLTYKTFIRDYTHLKYIILFLLKKNKV